MSQMTRSVTIEDAKQALIVMFNGFNIGGNEVERKVKISAYWSVLCCLPPGAIAAACRDACRCRLGNAVGFPPTVDVLYRRAVSYLPRAPIEPPAQETEIRWAERARVRILIRDLADAMKALPDRMCEPVASVEEKIAVKYRGAPLPKLSDELQTMIASDVAG